jgi:hypothetical protein
MAEVSAQYFKVMRYGLGPRASMVLSIGYLHFNEARYVDFEATPDWSGHLEPCTTFG